MRKKPEKSFNIKCVECGKEFSVTPTYFYKKKIRRCSLECAYKARIGKKKSEEHKRKIGLAHIGIIPYIWTKDQRERRGKERKGIYPLRNKKGEELEKIYKIIAEKNRKPRADRRGKNCWNWKGGISKENHKIRSSWEYKQWKVAIIDRDGRACKECGAKGENIELHVDHIKPFALYPDLRFDINNGRMLCVSCHKKTDTYGVKLCKYK